MYYYVWENEHAFDSRDEDACEQLTHGEASVFDISLLGEPLCLVLVRNTGLPNNCFHIQVQHGDCLLIGADPLDQKDMERWFKEKKEQDERLKEDSRLKCVMADGGGDRATYRLPGYDNVFIEFEMYDEYPWTPVPVDPRNGRILSGEFYSYQTSKDAVDAIINGELDYLQ